MKRKRILSLVFFTPVDVPATHAVLDWCSDGLYLVNQLDNAAVYRFVFHPPEPGGSRSGVAQ